MGKLSNKAMISRLRSHGKLTNEYAQKVADLNTELQAQLDAVRNIESYSVTFVDKATFMRVTRQVVDADKLLAALNGEGKCDE